MRIRSSVVDAVSRKTHLSLGMSELVEMVLAALLKSMDDVVPLAHAPKTDEPAENAPADAASSVCCMANALSQVPTRTPRAPRARALANKADAIFFSLSSTRTQVATNARRVCGLAQCRASEDTKEAPAKRASLARGAVRVDRLKNAATCCVVARGSEGASLIDPLLPR